MLGKGKGDGSGRLAFNGRLPEEAWLRFLTLSWLVTLLLLLPYNLPVSLLLPISCTVPGLSHALYDRTAFIESNNLLDLGDQKPVRTDLAENAETPDSTKGVVHQYTGLLRVPHAGIYEFSFAPSSIGELTLGDTVVSRAGIPGAEISQSVTLSEGFVPFSEKIASGNGLIHWKGPGMSWQIVTADDLVALPARSSLSKDCRRVHRLMN